MERVTSTSTTQAILQYESDKLSNKLFSLTSRVARLAHKVSTLCSEASRDRIPELREHSEIPPWLERAISVGRLDVRAVSLITRIYTLEEALQAADEKARHLDRQHDRYIRTFSVARAVDSTFVGGELGSSFIPDLRKLQTNITEASTRVTELRRTLRVI